MKSMNLRQKTFLAVALSVSILLVGYVAVSDYYIGQQQERLYAARQDTANALAQEISDLFTRGVQRLRMVAELPGLLHSIESLDPGREDRQIPAWITLHYIFYQTDVFTDGLYMVDSRGKILWTEPPDVGLIETDYGPFAAISRGTRQDEAHFTLWEGVDQSDILVSVPMRGESGKVVATLIGEIPTSHPAIRAILERNPEKQGVAHLVAGDGKIVASADTSRERTRMSDANAAVLVASGSVEPAGWRLSIDQDSDEALADIRSLRLVLTAFGVIFLSLAMGSLIFKFRSFTRPV
jgi:hypothetical protein